MVLVSADLELAFELVSLSCTCLLTYSPMPRLWSALLQLQLRQEQSTSVTSSFHLLSTKCCTIRILKLVLSPLWEVFSISTLQVKSIIKYNYQVIINYQLPKLQWVNFPTHCPQLLKERFYIFGGRHCSWLIGC